MYTRKDKAALLWALVAMGLCGTAQAQSPIIDLANFNLNNGSLPGGGLTLVGNTLYGTTGGGGANYEGEVFSVPVLGGAPTVLGSFDFTFNGADPHGGLTLAGNTLYGTTYTGGANYSGTVFSIPLSGGAPTTVANFSGTNGFPYGTLTLIGSTLYGTTVGGAQDAGTVFSVSGGTPTTLTTFTGLYGYGNGQGPQGALTLMGNTLYGTTVSGGTSNDGVIFSEPLTGGTPTILANFKGTNGANPFGSLIVIGNTLYGTTSNGGAYSGGTVFSLPITGGAPTILASFGSTLAGARDPAGDLTLIGNTLYGTAGGGAYFDGSIFSVPVTGGTPTLIASFNGANGTGPNSGLTLDGNLLFGTTSNGGAAGDGVVFAVAVPGLIVGAQYWDGRGAANDGQITGGSGTWNATATNWTDAAGANSKWQGGMAVFGSTAGTVTLGGPISATGLVFQTDGYVISGSSALTLTGLSPVLTMNGSATIAVPIAGKNGLTESGPGKLILTNASNSYTGGTTVGGALQIGTTAAAGSIGAGPIAIDSGATLTVVNVAGNRLTNAVSDGAVGLATLVVSSANTITLSGALTDGAYRLALTQNGSGTTILANPGNFYSGATTVSRGVLQVGTASASGLIGPGSPIVVSGGGALKLVNVGGYASLTEPAVGAYDKETSVTANDFANNIENLVGSVILDPVSNLVVTGVISGTGAVTVVGVNPIDGMPMPGSSFAPVSTILTGSNTYTGPTTVSSGILQIGDSDSGSVALGSLVTVNRLATLALDLGVSGSFLNNVTNNGVMSLMGPNSYIVSGVLSGSGSLVKSDAGTALLTGANTYTGGTTINGGTLIADAHFGPSTGSGPVTVNNGATLGGNGQVPGKVTLNKGGTIFPGIDRSGPPGVGLQLGSLTWAGGSTLTFEYGPTGCDEILIAGPLTRAGSGPWNISVDYNGEPFGLSNPPTGALLTFSSTNFSLANFHLELPPGFTGTLVETKTSLLLENVQAVSAGGIGGDGGDGGITLGSGDGGGLTLNNDVGASPEVLTPTPEPGSALLFILGASAFLSRRRRRR